MAFAVFAVVPWATEEVVRPASIPSPTALLEVGVIAVAPGDQACTAPFVLTERSARAAFRMTTFARRGSAVAVRIRGPGYRAGGRIAAGYADNAPQLLPIRPPERPTVAEACFANLGPRPIGLFAAADGRSNSRSVSRVEGEAVDGDIALAFYEDKPVSLVERTPEIVERMTAFRPDPVGTWLLWPLLVLVVLGVPLAMTWAIGAAARADGDEPSRRGAQP
ncbi:MAG: hypothetical protein H0T43_11855 [Solirubrobacterales bacterium]|nr:hypothetical protein [Solirubrobacterales bacterium]